MLCGTSSATVTGGCFLAMVIGFAIARTLVIPLTSMTDLAHRLAAGDVSETVTYQSRR